MAKDQKDDAQIGLFNFGIKSTWSDVRKKQLEDLVSKQYGTARISYVMKIPEPLIVEQLKSLGLLS